MDWYLLYYGCCVLQAKQEKGHNSLDGHHVSHAHAMANVHIFDSPINAKRYIEVLEQHMLPSKPCLFQWCPCLFQQETAKPHSAHLTAAWLQSKRLQVLDWPACSPDMSPIENVWHSLKCKTHQQRDMSMGWDRIPLSKLKQLVSSLPKRFQCC